MPRTKRQKSHSGLYHITVRGIDRREIFIEDADCACFLKTLDHVREKTGYKLYAYCLMGNHVHLLIGEGVSSISIVMHRVGTSYAHYYNNKYDCCGHVFQNRFHSEPVDSEQYLWNVMKYICRNPVKAGLCSNPFSYRWLECSGTGMPVRDLPLDPISEVINVNEQNLLLFILNPDEPEKIKCVPRKHLSDQEAFRLLCNACSCRHAGEISGWEPEMRRRAILTGLHAGISIRQLSRITGISKSLIEKAAKQEKQGI